MEPLYSLHKLAVNKLSLQGFSNTTPSGYNLLNNEILLRKNKPRLATPHVQQYDETDKNKRKQARLAILAQGPTLAGPCVYSVQSVEEAGVRR